MKLKRFASSKRFAASLTLAATGAMFVQSSALAQTSAEQATAETEIPAQANANSASAPDTSMDRYERRLPEEILAVIAETEHAQVAFELVESRKFAMASAERELRRELRERRYKTNHDELREQRAAALRFKHIEVLPS